MKDLRIAEIVERMDLLIRLVTTNSHCSERDKDIVICWLGDLSQQIGLSREVDK